jgi:hypothetical protein
MSFVGLGILVGLFLKNKSVKNTAYVLFVVAAVFCFCQHVYRRRTEELVEDMPSIGKNNS